MCMDLGGWLSLSWPHAASIALSFIMVAFGSGGMKPLGAERQVFGVNHQAGTGASAYVSRATRRAL